MTPTDRHLKSILERVRTIACIGVSPNPVRPSHYVARYLSHRGYRVIPVNPGHAGAELFGERVVGGIGDLPGEVDMIDIFRKPEAVPGIVAEALERLPALDVVWMQIGIESAEARAMAEAKGVTVIENRCPKIEHQRLFGELRKAGFNTGVISSKL